MLKRLITENHIDQEAALVATYDWRTWWARDSQLAPAVSQSGGDWHVWLALAGRGFGKTRSGAQWFNEQAAIPGLESLPMAIVGRTAADVRDVLVEGPAGILAVSPPWNRPLYEPSKRRLTWKNGATATTFSAEEPDSLRGPQFRCALADEIAAWSHFDDAWSNLLMGTRLGDHPRIAALTTPRPLKMIRELLDDKDVAITRGATMDNAANLSKKAVEYLLRKFEGTRLGRQELEGVYLEDLPGALWTQEMLATARLNFRAWGRPFERDAFERIVVAVDPSGSDGDDEGDAQGIVVAGKFKKRDDKGRPLFVLLEDRTDQRRPEEWAAETNRLAEKWNADSIIAEKNYGGAMVRATLAQAKPFAPVRLVNASKGKTQRAEPISALYEQCIAEGQLVETESGARPIESIRAGERVWTRQGLKEVLWAGSTGVKETILLEHQDGVLECTPDHPIYCPGKGFVEAGRIKPERDSLLAWRQNSHAPIAALPFGRLAGDAGLAAPQSAGKLASPFGNSSNSAASDTSKPRRATTAPLGMLAASFCTALSGAMRAALSDPRSIPAATSITLTKTRLQTNPATCAISRLASICGFMLQPAPLSGLRHAPKFPPLRNAAGRQSSHEASPATNAAPTSKAGIIQALRDFARLPATANIGLRSVGVGGPRRVFNLHVRDCHEYFAGGILVHNCRVAHAHDAPDLTVDAEDRAPRAIEAGTSARGFAEMEEELTQFTGSKFVGKRSPNRADAAIWALTALAVPVAEPGIRSL